MSQTINAIIVDDEPLARQSLKKALKDIAGITILEECANGFEAVQAVQRVRPDLLFLDIQMPKLDGFDVVELLGNEAPFVIFVTSYDEYALRAFEAEALDYLLKPVKADRLKKAVARVRERLQVKESQPFDTLLDKHRDSLGPLDRVLIRDGSNVFIIPVEDIIYVEAQDDYIKIYTPEKSYLKTQRLSNLEKAVPPRRFCRIHRSYLLNIDHLKKIEPYTKDSRLALLKNGAKLPISRSGYSRLMERL